MGCFGDACHSCQAMSRLRGPGHGVTMGPRPRPRYAKHAASDKLYGPCQHELPGGQHSADAAVGGDVWHWQ